MNGTAITRYGPAMLSALLLLAPGLDVRAEPTRALLRETQETFRAVADRLRPSLVRIETLGGSQPGGGASRRNGGAPPEDGTPPAPFKDTTGSTFVVADGPTTGMIYTSDGYIIASSFNFIRKPLLISVTLADGRRLAADLVARDRVRKIALLKVEATGLVVPEWRPRRDVRVGEWAVALGLGFGGDHASVAAGIVSALSRMHGNALQTDAKLSPANYGGPLCDIHGRVLGICVPMAQRPGELAGIEMYDAGVGFAVPRDRVDAIVSVLMTGESIYRGWLGIAVDPHRTEGAVIRRIADPSPMRLAGVRTGDAIVWAAGRDVRHFDDLVQAVYMIPAGQPVSLVVRRATPQPVSALWVGDRPCIRYDNTVRECGITVTLARSTELGPLERVDEHPDPPTPPPSREPVPIP